MSRLVLDDQLDLDEIRPSLEGWITFVCLHELRPGEVIRDDRVPEILLTLKQPTFVTIDHGFWNPKWCHRGYCILYFALNKDQQHALPGLLRRVFRLPEFHTRKARMGKVVRVQAHRVTYWERGAKKPCNLPM